MASMSDILSFWASRLPGGRHELDRNQVIDDVLAWGRLRGAKLHWLGPILGRTEVQFFTSSAFSSVRYTRKSMLILGGDIELPAECVTAEGRVNDARMESIVHELWHAYSQHFAEKGEGDAGIAQLFAAAMVGLRGKVADAAVREAADEVIGNYATTVTECLKLHIPNSSNPSVAQKIWSQISAEDMRTIDLTGGDYPRINAVCVIPERVAHEVRVKLFGLDDSVLAWPTEARTWEVRA